jgi:hypothetical protein
VFRVEDTTILDGCGGTLTCGTCSAPQTCCGGGIANVCGPTFSLTATGRAGERILSTPSGLSVPVGTTGSAPFAPGTRITLGVTNAPGRDLVGGVQQRRKQDPDLHLHQPALRRKCLGVRRLLHPPKRTTGEGPGPIPSRHSPSLSRKLEWTRP